MHSTGFEPALFLRKWIMSPLLSTTQPQMQKKVEPVGIEPTCIKSMSIPEGPEKRETSLFFFMSQSFHEEKKKKELFC